jgi:hypothetical protein
MLSSNAALHITILILSTLTFLRFGIIE